MLSSFDSETLSHNNKLIPYCICFHYENSTTTFFGLDCVEKFLDHVFEIGEKRWKKGRVGSNLIIFSHNLTFDGSILLQNISKKNYKFTGLFFKGNIYFLTIIRKKIRITLKCSFRFFPGSLASASQKLGTGSKLDFDHASVSLSNFNEKNEEVIKYCTVDSRIVLEIIKIINRVVSPYLADWYTIIHSLPGLAIKIFEKTFNNYGLKLLSHESEDALFRPSYFGGRCEVFGNPEKGDIIYHYDYTGMYAQVMTENFNFDQYWIVEHPLEIEDNGFYYIEGFSCSNLPVLPHHSANEKKLLFCSGYVCGLFWWEEIRLFQDMGGKIFDIRYAIKFKKNEPIFKEFVETFTDLRKTDLPHNTLCKLIVNSIYGRLGMSEVLTETKLLNNEQYLKFRKLRESSIVRENWINDYIFVEYQKNKKEIWINSKVYLAAMITSKARIKLFKGFLSVIRNGGRLLYCDTDSIFASFKENVDNRKFDEVFFDCLKPDTKIKKALFALPKAYSIIYQNGRTVTKIKGINNSSISFDEFEQLFSTNKTIRVNIATLKKANFIITPANVQKIICLCKYNKRTFNDNGILTSPLWLNKDGTYTTKPSNFKYDNNDEFTKLVSKLNLKSDHPLKIYQLTENRWKLYSCELLFKKNHVILVNWMVGENIVHTTLAIELLLISGLYSYEFEITNKVTIFKKLKNIDDLDVQYFYFWGDYERILTFLKKKME